MKISEEIQTGIVLFAFTLFLPLTVKKLGGRLELGVLINSIIVGVLVPFLILKNKG